MVCFRHVTTLRGMAYGAAPQSSLHQNYVRNQQKNPNVGTQVNYGRNQSTYSPPRTQSLYNRSPITIGSSNSNRWQNTTPNVETIIAQQKERIVLDSPPSYEPIGRQVYKNYNISSRNELSRDISRELVSSKKRELATLIQEELNQQVQYNV